MAYIDEFEFGDEVWYIKKDQVVDVVEYENMTELVMDNEAITSDDDNIVAVFRAPNHVVE